MSIILPRPRLSVLSSSGAGAGLSSYATKLLAIESANLLAYWPLQEGSGAVADNLQGNADRDGAYTGVDLGQAGIGDGWTSPYFDGVNDVVDVYSASLASAFSGAEGTMSCWWKVLDASIWTDGSYHYIFSLSVDASNFARVLKSSINGRLSSDYRAGGTWTNYNWGSRSDTDWVHWAIVWSKAGDYVNHFLAGSKQSGSGLGVWAGSLHQNTCGIGSQQGVSAVLPWNGWIAHAAVWDKPLSDAQIAQLASV